MTPRHIFMIGFMGAGKSTVASLVAEALHMPCIDLDARIERAAGVTVAELFATRGEEAFRDLETDALLALAAEEPAVVACGGGIVLRPENRSALRDMGTVVYLRVDASEALARVGDCSTRPLLSGPSGSLAATSLLKAREGLYRSVADIEVDTLGVSAGEVAALVVDGLESRR